MDVPLQERKKGHLPSKRHSKSRSGCQRCKQRRIKCDETIPACGPCMKRGFNCPGYQKPVKWRHLDGTGKCPQKAESAADPYNGTTTHFSDLAGPSSSAVSRAFPKSFNHRVISPALPTTHGLIDEQPEASGLDIIRQSNGIDHIIENDFSNLGDLSLPGFSNEDIWDLGHDIPDFLLDCSKFNAEYHAPIFKQIEEKSTILSSHYFSVVCIINSCFDSPVNPLRAVIGDLMASSQLVYHVVMAASASHICNQKKDMTSLAVQHRGDAVSCLIKNKHTTGNKVEALLGSVLLGITSAWQDPSNLGLSHIFSARILFQKWIDEQEDVFNSRSAYFLVGVMAYWEAMVSLLTMNSAHSLDYLVPFCGQEQRDAIVYPNPWTGVSTTLFIHAAQVGALCRQNRITKSLSASMLSDEVRDGIFSEQLRSAAELEEKVLQYTPPELSKIEDPNDASTPVSHFQTLAQIYRFAVLLQLYLTFPELLQQMPVDPPLAVVALEADLPVGISNTPLESSRKTTIGLAISLLNLISSVPESSGIKVLLGLPLMIAGSVLQNPGNDTHIKPHHASKAARVQDEINSLQCSETMISYWRSYTRQKLKALHAYVGLDPVLRSLQILEAVWLRSDLDIPDDTKPQPFVHWLDAMIEERLESVFG